jgi:prefoldin subunit 5
MAKPPRDRRTQPAPERAYERADPRIDRLEDTISHFYNVINELRERVSTLEKKLEQPIDRAHGGLVSKNKAPPRA